MCVQVELVCAPHPHKIGDDGVVVIVSFLLSVVVLTTARPRSLSGY
jgi:hypothetical protein